MTFEILGAIERVETIAKGRGIPELPRLMAKHGTGRWKKMKGVADVRFEDGSLATAETHWYEAHGIGKRDLKIKRVIAKAE